MGFPLNVTSLGIHLVMNDGLGERGCTTLFFALIWDLSEQHRRLHYLPTGCLQSLSDKRNDLDVPVSSLPLCGGVCLCVYTSVCVWYTHLLNCSQLTGWLFSPDWPQWLDCVSWAQVYLCVCVCVFLTVWRLPWSRSRCRRTWLDLYKMICNILVALPLMLSVLPPKHCH